MISGTCQVFQALISASQKLESYTQGQTSGAAGCRRADDLKQNAFACTDKSVLHLAR